MLVETVTSDKVCEALHITPKTLIRMEKEGKIPFSKVGRKKIYLAEDINRLIYEKYRK